MKTTPLRAMKILLGSVILGLAGTHAAYAISVAGSSGKDEQALNDPSCFVLGGVTVRSDPNCGPNLSNFWLVPLPANVGNHTVSVSGTNSSAGNMNCQVCTALNAFIQPVCSTLVFPPNATSVATTTVNLPTAATLYFECQFPPNSGINTINYNQ